MRKIRFAPGKGNQKLIAMYNDGAEVWDTKEVSPPPCVAVTHEKLLPAETVVFFLLIWKRKLCNGLVKLKTIFFLKFFFYSISVPKATA